MSKEKSRCPYDEPDCFNCPFNDCRATLKDLNRQQAIQRKKMLLKRNEDIVNSFNKGATVIGLAEKYDLDTATIISILNKNGISAVRGRARVKRSRSKRNENETSGCKK